MKTCDTTLLRSEQIAEGTMAFHLAKPDGFAFKAGQAIDLILSGTAGSPSEDMRHAFSIASAPRDTELVVATRMRDSAYKRLLVSLSPGAPLMLDGPFGSLTLHRDMARPAIFIAGGIGITPFISMLRESNQDLPPRDLMLIYANRRPEDAPFLDELRHIEKRNPRFKLVATMTGMSASKAAWEGHTSQINRQFLTDVLTGHDAPVHYLAGPPRMVQSVHECLTSLGVSDDDVRSEDFFGY